MKGKIFNSQEVQAIIAGKKTMFREVVKTQPQLKIGQKIFVKEAFVDFRHNNSDIFYKSDFEINNLVRIADLKWKSARFMKQEQSRITLRIKSVKVKGLQDINEEDAIKEGFIEQDDISNPPPIEQFANYWNSTQKKQEHKWEANPWVFVYEFEIINLKK